MAEKFILDATCGNRQIWFQKNEPHTIYCDIRKEKHEMKTNNGGTKTLNIDPDVICDFTNLPFADNTFSLVVFDPPHAKNLSEASLLRKEYGSLQNDWKPIIKKGFRECMRVLKPNGVLIFKWSAVHIPTREIINVIGEEPLFGHRSGKKMNTHWLCFMKLADHKTENSSEKPNNCEDLQDWKDRMWAEAIVTEPTISKMEQVDKDTNVRSKDDTQTDCGWK